MEEERVMRLRVPAVYEQGVGAHHFKYIALFVRLRFFGAIL